MKKNRSILILLISVLTMFGVLTACKNEGVAIPYISFTNNFIAINKYYFVGDEIELNKQSINYYVNIKNSEPTESNIVVTKDMISNFSTQKAGECSFKINYKNANTEINYYVYEKPDITASYGYYTSTIFDKDIVVEIKHNEIVVNYYGNGYTSIEESKPTLITAMVSKLKANKEGIPSIKFDYEKEIYEFTNFVNGIPTRVKKTNNYNNNQSTISLICTKIG